MAKESGPAGTDSRSSSDANVSKAGEVPARILMVEDQKDVRRMFATALEIEGYLVDEAANAHEGLRQLLRRHYQLVLTDHAMPGGTGSWMIEEAERLGLMKDTAAMIVTAHPDVHALADIPVLNKPLDIDYFLEQVRKLVGRPPAPEMRNRSSTGATPTIELVLYISSSSFASVQARENLEEVLARYPASQVNYTVIDLLENPFAGESDRIAFTPTLVKRHPAPRRWILGNLRDKGILVDLLRASGIDGGPGGHGSGPARG
jgi:CheY-like chemotaxis protein